MNSRNRRIEEEKKIIGEGILTDRRKLIKNIIPRCKEKEKKEKKNRRNVELLRIKFSNDEGAKEKEQNKKKEERDEGENRFVDDKDFIISEAHPNRKGDDHHETLFSFSSFPSTPASFFLS